MKQFLMTALAAGVGVSLALLGYDHFIVKPREAQKVTVATQVTANAEQAATAAARIEVSQAQDEAQKKIAETVESSVQRSVDRSIEQARKSVDAHAAEMDHQALLIDTVRRATMFKVALSEFHATHGRWPRDADEAGLPSPEEMQSGAVRSVSVREKGVIEVALDQPFEAESAIVLVPRVKAATGMIDWSCEARGDSRIRQVLQRCN